VEAGPEGGLASVKGVGAKSTSHGVKSIQQVRKIKKDEEEIVGGKVRGLFRSHTQQKVQEAEVETNDCPNNRRKSHRCSTSPGQCTGRRHAYKKPHEIPAQVGGSYSDQEGETDHAQEDPQSRSIKTRQVDSTVSHGIMPENGKHAYSTTRGAARGQFMGGDFPTQDGISHRHSGSYTHSDREVPFPFEISKRSQKTPADLQGDESLRADQDLAQEEMRAPQLSQRRNSLLVSVRHPSTPDSTVDSTYDGRGLAQVSRHPRHHHHLRQAQKMSRAMYRLRALQYQDDDTYGGLFFNMSNDSTDFSLLPSGDEVQTNSGPVKSTSTGQVRDKSAPVTPPKLGQVLELSEPSHGEPALEKPKLDSKLPLYVPQMKAIDLEKLSAAASHSPKLCEALEWLRDPRRYTALLRHLPRRKRKSFTNENMIGYEDLLLNSGILKEVAANTIFFAECNVFGIDEEVKGRRRLIIEPRDLNLAWKRCGFPHTFLPYISDVARVAHASEDLTSADLQCFFYQIPLSPEIQNFFGVTIGKRKFLLQRLPMGACISVFVAQQISESIHNIAWSASGNVSSSSSVTYIDNWIGTGDMVSAYQEAAEHVGAILKENTVAKSHDVLGLEITAGESIRISQRIIRHTQFVNEFEAGTTHPLRCILRGVGIALRGAEIARRPLADSFFLMHAIRRVARSISGQEVVNLDASQSLSPREHSELMLLLRETLARPVIPLETWIRQDMRKEDVLFTDATPTSLGYVLVTKGRGIAEHHVTAKYARLPRELPIHEAEGAAVRWALEDTDLHRNLQIYVDNTIVLSAIARGHGSTPEVNAAAWAVSRRTGDTTVEWIPSKENPADGPSRGVYTEATEGLRPPVNQQAIVLRRWSSVSRAPPRTMDLHSAKVEWERHSRMDIH
jgi:hypothetical protein